MENIQIDLFQLLHIFINVLAGSVVGIGIVLSAVKQHFHFVFSKVSGDAPNGDEASPEESIPQSADDELAAEEAVEVVSIETEEVVDAVEYLIPQAAETDP